MHQAQAVAQHFGLAHVVGGKNSAVLALFGKEDEIQNGLAGHDVQAQCGLVENKHLRIVQDYPGDVHLLGLPRAEGLAATFQQFGIFLSAPLVGWLADRWGARPIALASFIATPIALLALSRTGNSVVAWDALWLLVSLAGAGTTPAIWARIVSLYDLLQQADPSPVVELNRAVAIGQRDGPAAGLEALARLERDPSLSAYPWLSAARADALRRLGRADEALTAYRAARELARDPADRRHFERQIAALSD